MTARACLVKSKSMGLPRLAVRRDAEVECETVRGVREVRGLKGFTPIDRIERTRTGRSEDR
jgi:hypothetical protein